MVSMHQFMSFKEVFSSSLLTFVDPTGRSWPGSDAVRGPLQDLRPGSGHRHLLRVRTQRRIRRTGEFRSFSTSFSMAGFCIRRSHLTLVRHFSQKETWTEVRRATEASLGSCTTAHLSAGVGRTPA